MISKDGHAIAVDVAAKDDLATARDYYPELRALVRSDTLTIQATGLLAINNGFNNVLQEDLHRAEVVSLPLALVLLLVVFGSIVAALVPLGVGVLAVVGGIAGMYLVARVTDVSVYALNVVTLIGLGVAIDYSLFITNRFREEMRRGHSGNNALAIAMATSGRAITFSGLTVAIGLSGMLFFQGTFLSSMGITASLSYQRSSRSSGGISAAAASRSCSRIHRERVGGTRSPRRSCVGRSSSWSRSLRSFSFSVRRSFICASRTTT
jgi:RND superfamily putative drug exporter